MTASSTMLTGVWVIGVVLACTGSAGVAAQAAPGEVRISAIDVPRPMSVAAREVERQFGRVVTYEDLSYVAPSEIVDVTAQVRRDGRFGERVYGMRNGGISISYTPTNTSIEAQVDEALPLLVAKWNESSQSGHFTVGAVAGGHNLIPTARKGPSESLEPDTPPLSARISFPSEERDGLNTIAAVAQAISSAAGRPVTPGMMPINLLNRARLVVGAQDQVAREVLWNVLQALDPSLSWQVLCGVGENAACAINIHPARKG